MHVFKDALDRDWRLEINLDSRNEVLARTDGAVDFLDVAAIEKLADLATLGATLYALCQEQIESLKLTERQFAQALKGDAFERARDALGAELCDFFPSGKRQLMLKALAKVRTLEATALAEANKAIDSKHLDRLLEKKLKSLSGDWPESSASTPDPSNSGN